MKKLSLLLPGAIALLLSATPVLVAHAQSTPTAPTGQRMQKQNRLNLTDAQKAKLKTIRENTRQQIEGVLTSEQRAKLQAERGQQGMKRGQGWKSLNLSDDQKARIKAIRQASRTQMDSVLTLEQRSQIQQYKSQRRAKPAQ